MEIVTAFIFGGSQITADVDCSHEIKRHLLLGEKAVTNLLLLSRLTRVRLCAAPQTAAHQAPVPGTLQARTLQWAAIAFSSA